MNGRTISQEQNTRQLITKLTALWAVSESGLGGFFHAVKLPFSGLILGSFAVIIVTFIALNSEKKFRTIINATLLVILIKAIASPHSPFTAYIAVAFQGFVGALIYAFAKPNYFSAVLYGIIALLESAFQKLLMLTVVFGENIWTAFSQFFQNLAQQFSFQAIENFPVAAVGIYAGAYFIAGIAAGFYGLTLPGKISSEAEKLKTADILPSGFSPDRKKKNRKLSGLIFTGAILLFIVTVFLLSGSVPKALQAILRTAAAILIIFAVVNPLFKYLIARWKTSAQSRKQNELNAVLHFVPEFRKNVNTAWNYAAAENGWLRKINRFLIVWLALSLYLNENHHD